MGPDNPIRLGDEVYVRFGGATRHLRLDTAGVCPDSVRHQIRVSLNCHEICEEPDVRAYFLFPLELNTQKQMIKKVIYNPPAKQMIKKVIYNPPATIIYWADGSKSVVKCMEGDEFDPEKGLAIGIAQKFVSKKEIKNWLPKNWELPEEEIPDLTGLSWKTEFFDEMGSKTKFDLTASTQIKEDDEDKKPSFLGNAIRDLTDIFKGAVKGE